jgi:hypothetical protein
MSATETTLTANDARGDHSLRRFVRPSDKQIVSYAREKITAELRWLRKRSISKTNKPTDRFNGAIVAYEKCLKFLEQWHRTNV